MIGTLRRISLTLTEIRESIAGTWGALNNAVAGIVTIAHIQTRQAELLVELVKEVRMIRAELEEERTGQRRAIVLPVESTERDQYGTLHCVCCNKIVGSYHDETCPVVTP